MGMNRPGIEPSFSRMLSGCDATTPSAPELRRPRGFFSFLVLSAAGAAVDKRVRPGKAREAKLLWLERDVRHPAAAERAAGG